MATRTLDQKTFVWAHVATILFHLIIASLLIWWTRTDINYAKLKKYVFWTGIVLFVVSALAFWPILGKSYNIEVNE